MDANLPPESESVLWERPIFILSPGRSGSSYLTMLLNRHPDVAMAAEANLFVFLKMAHLLATRPESFPQFAPILEAIELIPKGYRPAVDHVFWPAGRVLLQAFYRRQFPQKRFRRWGDKITTYWVLPELVEQFPQAQIIHLVRDGRDRTLSAMHYLRQRAASEPQRAVKQPTFEAHCRYWVKCHSRLLEGLRNHPQTMLLRYEDLIAEPDRATERLLRFLGLAESDLWQAAHPARDQPFFQHHATSQSPGRSVGRWRRELTAAQQATAAAIMGPLLATFHYDA